MLINYLLKMSGQYVNCIKTIPFITSIIRVNFIKYYLLFCFIVIVIFISYQLTIIVMFIFIVIQYTSSSLFIIFISLPLYCYLYLYINTFISSYMIYHTLMNMGQYIVEMHLCISAVLHEPLNHVCIIRHWQLLHNDYKCLKQHMYKLTEYTWTATTVFIFF